MELDALTRELLVQFVQLCGERIGEITVVLLNNKEGNLDPNQLQGALSQLHTLKGEAGMLDISEISVLTHALEARIKRVQQQGRWDIPIELVLTALDTIQTIAEAKAEQKTVKQDVIQQLTQSIQESQLNTPVPQEKRDSSQIPSLTEEQHGTEATIVAPVVEDTMQEDHFGEEMSTVTPAVEDTIQEEQHGNASQEDAKPLPKEELRQQEVRLPQLEAEKMAVLAKRAAPATERLPPEMVEPIFQNKKNDSTRRLETITRKRLTTGSLPIEIHKLEDLSAQIEKVVTSLIFFNNLWKNFQTTGSSLRDVFLYANHLLDHTTNVPPMLEKGAREIARQLHHILNLYEGFYEQSSPLMLDMETANEELIIQNLEFRLLPVSVLVQHFHRGVHEMAKELGKEVKLETKGLETALDRGILEKFSEPVVHILRNAIDHGIEPPERREASGKSRYGTITFQAQTKGREVEIMIADDGRGIDLDAIAAKAVEKGILPPQDVANLSDRDKMEMIFRPNFSTRSEASQFSGRGIGMDIVKKAVDMMDGKITVHSQKGKGTSFIIQLPITLAKLCTLLVHVGNISVCIPTYYVEEVMYLTPQDIQIIGGIKSIVYRDENIPLQWLHRKLGIPCEEESIGTSNKLAVMVLKMHNKNCMAFVVDKLLGEREVIFKPFNRFLKKYRIFAAATLLDEGHLAYLLNIGKLSQSAAPIASTRAVKTKKKILLVEDSPIVREMEKTILESYNYEVIEAANGKIAVELLQKIKPDLLITDIEMPEMNGLELTQYVRMYKKHQFPVIIVSTKGTAEDKAAGLEVGADAYLCKGEFDSHMFIDNIRKWL
jgi:two-component system chemotaxis sensor kinase CheA